jgi:hypothetical protein
MDSSSSLFVDCGGFQSVRVVDAYRMAPPPDGVNDRAFGVLA